MNVFMVEKWVLKFYNIFAIRLELNGKNYQLEKKCPK
jgi:hypothetical protein